MSIERTEHNIKICNCGGIMEIEEIFVPKSYRCQDCQATLVICNGKQKWSDADGKPGTYQPKDNS